MRFSIAIAGVFFVVLGSGAQAAEVPATSHVDAVTVFLSGAEVTRTAKLKLEKGEHVIIVADLPAEAVPGSIRVDGKATAKLDILSVDTRRRFVPRADQATAETERKALEDEIEKLRDERGLSQGQQDAAQTQKTLLTNLAQLPSQPQDQDARTVPQSDWGQILAIIGTGMAEAQRNALDAEVKIRELDRKIEDLEKKLSALAPAKVEQTEVKIYVVAADPLEADLTVRYQVRNASWLPRYDARLSTGSKTEPPRLDLTRRAEIKQRTEEGWDNVALQLSTTQPTANAAAPELDPMTVDFESEPKPAMAAAPPPPAAEGFVARGGALKMKQAEEAAASEADKPAPDVDIVQQQAAVAAAPFQATFTVPGRLSIPATGEAKRVQLQQDGVEPLLLARTVPKLDPKAYLYAKFILPKGSPLLPGPVSLFRDGTFVGEGDLPILSPGEDHELGFGADDQVRVRHAIVDQKRGEIGLISSARTDSRNFRITVKNMHERAVQLVVRDQIPASQNQDIKVDLIGPTAPTAKDIDDKRGVISFASKLEPEGESVIEFGYRVTWPGSRPIVYSHQP